jgi:hypothetical protein
MKFLTTHLIVHAALINSECDEAAASGLVVRVRDVKWVLSGLTMSTLQLEDTTDGF